MSPSDLTKPFAESCCDGGICSTSKESSQPCGCDLGAGWTCQQHQVREPIDAAKQDIYDALGVNNAVEALLKIEELKVKAMYYGREE